MGRYGSIACGVDLDGGAWTFVEASRRRGAIQFRRLSGPPGDAAPVAAAMPVFSGFVRRLTAPIASVEKARRVLPSLLDIELPFPLESCQYDFLSPARTADGGVAALAVAARTEDVVAQLDRLREAGCDPVALEHEAVALWRYSVAELPLGREHRRLLVHLGRSRVSAVAGSFKGLDSATGLRLGAEELAAPGSPAGQRLALWWRAQQEQAPGAVCHVVWCGPVAERAAVRDAIAAQIFPGGVPKSIVHKEPAEFLPRALAVGLLTRAEAEGDLRQGALAHPLGVRLAQGRRRGLGVALAAAAAALAVVSFSGLALLEHAKELWQERLVAEARLAAGTDRLPRGQELLAAQRALDGEAAGWASFARYREPGADAVLARVLGDARTLGLHFHALTAQGAALRLHGTANDWNDGERFASALGTAGWRVELERRDAGADERVHFTLQGER